MGLNFFEAYSETWDFARATLFSMCSPDKGTLIYFLDLGEDFLCFRHVSIDHAV